MLSNEFLAAAMAAPSDRLAAALAVLKGDNRPEQAAKPVVHEKFVSLQRLQEVTGIGRITLWRYNVPGHRHAGRMRYRVSEVLAFLESPQFQTVVAALRANGWKRPTAAEIARVSREETDLHAPNGENSSGVITAKLSKPLN